MQHHFFTTILIFLSLSCFSQQYDVAVGGWRVHAACANSRGVETINNELFYAGHNTVLRLDLSDRSIHRIDKSTGLSDVSIACIGISSKHSSLVIGYVNGNIDIYQSGFVTNLPDIVRKSINGDKTIYAVACRGDYAYLACGFGIVVVDLKKLTVQESWFSEINNQIRPIKDITFLNDTLFAISDEYVFQSPLNNGLIRDFHTWRQVPVESSRCEFTAVETFHDRIFLLNRDTFLHADNSKRLEVMMFSLQPGDTSFKRELSVADPVQMMRSSGKHLIVGIYLNTMYYTWDEANRNLRKEVEYAWTICRYGVSTASGRHFFADEQQHDLVEGISGEAVPVGLNGPEKDGVSAMDWQNSKLVLTHAFVPAISPSYIGGFVSVYRNNAWDALAYKQERTYADLTDVLIAPYDTSVVFAASYLFGLIKIKNGMVETVYNGTNSPIRSVYGWDSVQNYVRTPCKHLAFDSRNNLWISTYQTDHPVYILTPDGKWHMPTTPLLSRDNSAFTRFFVDSRGWIWIIDSRYDRLLLYNTRNTEDVSDDQCIRLSKVSTEPTDNFSFIYCVAEDRSRNAVWIGTERGIKVFYSVSQLFDNPSKQPQPIKVTNITQTDTITELLLGWTTVNCIAVDGGNRKWVGTANAGVYLLSDDGKKELFHFTAQNSPLPSDNVVDICIDGQTGEVYFGTDKGLVSFRYTATEPKDDYLQVKIFPNPVRPDFNGYISITGLKENSEVKITDAQGNIAYRTRSNGGTASWDGICFNGKKASTGVYFVFMCDETGKEKKAGKILFIR
jgi:hypothetical protein